MVATDDSDSEGAGLTFAVAITGNGADDALFRGKRLHRCEHRGGHLPHRARFRGPDRPAGPDGTYEIEVSVTDSGGLSTTQAVAITVTDVNEVPVLTDPGAISVPETVPGLVVNLDATDAEDSEGAG